MCQYTFWHEPLYQELIFPEPLPADSVRFLDNFSAGTRGAASAEHFLRTGQYAVIFMHRQHSLQPFSRHYSHSTNPFLDLLEVSGNGPPPTAAVPLGKGKEVEAEGSLFPALPPLPQIRPPMSPRSSTRRLPSLSAVPTLNTPSSSSPPPPSSSAAASGIMRTSTPSHSSIYIAEPHLSPMLQILKSYKVVQDRRLLHTMTFTTVTEYLWLLKGVAEVMGDKTRPAGQGRLGRKGMFYLAAAVSDFFVPQQKMVGLSLRLGLQEHLADAGAARQSEHKIQSGKGSLILEMDQVPKILQTLTQQWSADGYIVSFKLETDASLLIPKARASLERYGHQLVIGNELNTRKWKVVFVEGGGKEEWLLLGKDEQEAIEKEGEKEIEEEIIRRLQEKHRVWIDAEPPAAS